MKEEDLKAWLDTDGNNTLRLDYELDEKSIVFDIGSYEGDWAAKILHRYSCAVHCFEPVEEYFNVLKGRFENNSLISLHNFGLWNESAEFGICKNGDASSIIVGNVNSTIQLVDAHTFLSEFHSIDLAEINIEGSEYVLLNYLIETGDIRLFKNLQIQFHDTIPNALDSVMDIRLKLARTHVQTYCYEFVFESWRLK